jgi:hypothetical protein
VSCSRVRTKVTETTPHEREFTFLGSSVAVPGSILKNWALVPEAEKGKVIRSVCAVYLEEKLKIDCASVEPSVVARELMTGEAAPTAIQLWHDFLKNQETPRKKLSRAEVKERVLRLLQFQGYRDCNCSPLEAASWYAFKRAISEGDHHFLRALSDRVEKKPVPYKPPPGFSPLAALLLKHWYVKEGISLCWFSNKALACFLKQTNQSYMPEKIQSYIPDTIKKAYKRLGLQKLHRPLVLGSEVVVGKQIIRLR